MQGEGAARAAEAALIVNGGLEVKLRMPGMATANSAAEELGLAAPEFQDLPIGSAVWRKAGSDKELLLSGAAIAVLAGSTELDAVDSLLSTAVGVVVSGVVYRITGVSAVAANGIAGLFRLRLQAPEGAWTAA